jgi:hypothetical protein
VGCRLHDDDTVAATDLTPGAGELAFAVAEGPPGWLGEYVVAAPGAGGLHGVAAADVGGDRSHQGGTGGELRHVVDVDGDAAGPPHVQGDPAIGAR